MILDLHQPSIRDAWQRDRFAKSRGSNRRADAFDLFTTLINALTESETQVNFRWHCLGKKTVSFLEEFMTKIDVVRGILGSHTSTRKLLTRATQFLPNMLHRLAGKCQSYVNDGSAESRYMLSSNTGNYENVVKHKVFCLHYLYGNRGLSISFAKK